MHRLGVEDRLGHIGFQDVAPIELRRLGLGDGINGGDEGPLV